VPHWESIVQKRFAIEAPYVIGADGPDSTARSCMNIEFQFQDKPASFLVYEFETEHPVENEARIVMGPNSTDALWPLSATRCRWTFEMLPVAEAAEFPQKERDAFVFTECDTDENILTYARQATRIRAPWFRSGVKEVIWRAPVDFVRHMVTSFGHAGCWLAGDAAHQTMPFTSQSMNAGLHEAKVLTDAIRKILHQDASTSLLDAYGRQTHDAWTQLLDPKSLKAGSGVDPWIAQNIKRLLPCLPATGEDLERVAQQLHLQLARSMAVAR
jgi:3-(3-hydroxy-phenyl)propionate hydroxylase